MKVIAMNKIKEAQQKYPAASEPLLGWCQILNQSEFYSENGLRETFGDMRGFDYQYRFPIPGTTLLIHTLINFESQVAFIEEIKPGNH